MTHTNIKWTLITILFNSDSRENLKNHTFTGSKELKWNLQINVNYPQDNINSMKGNIIYLHLCGQELFSLFVFYNLWKCKIAHRQWKVEIMLMGKIDRMPTNLFPPIYFTIFLTCQTITNNYKINAKLIICYAQRSRMGHIF